VDASDPLIRREVAVGDYALVLGDRAGTAIVSADSGVVPSPLAQAIVPADRRDEPHSLAQALARARRERDPPRTGAAVLEGVAKDASDVAGKVERVVGLFTEVAEGRTDPASISDEVGVLCDLVQRLDREGRWKEALRLVRALAVLLALLERWIELLRSLRVALGAAERLADDLGKAWAQHEQGTWHLAADKHAEADELLGRARDLRRRIGDRRGLAVTERNLQALCQALRAGLHSPRPDPWPHRFLERILRNPLLALVLAMSLFLVGGAAGTVIAGDAGSTTSRTLVVGVALTPAAPRVGEPAVFRVTAEDGAHLAHYAWRFSDRDPTTIANPTHVYRRPGTYTVTVTASVSGVRGARTAEGTRTVVVHPELHPSPKATFFFQPISPVVGRPVSFDATGSSDPDSNASITSYTWKFGDGRSATGSTATPTHTYTSLGPYTAELIVADTRHAKASTARRITVKSAPPRPTAPSAPTGVTASAGDGSATVTWTAPLDGGSAITSYTITHYIGAEAQPTTLVSGSPPATSTTVSGLTNGTTYTFTVTATNAVGPGPPSAHSSAVTPTGERHASENSKAAAPTGEGQASEHSSAGTP
jgi:PKD repeat protein